jgi:multiple sugar transport system substrate-binding protein
MGTTHRRAAVLAFVAALAAVVAGCGSGASESEDRSLTVWTLESQPERVATLERLAGDFGARDNVEVKVVAVDQLQFNQLLTSSAASGELPDVIAGVGLDGVGSLAANDLLDTQVAREVVDALGPETFATGALDLATVDGTLLAVPSDSAVSILLYRRDLFEAAGLPAPTDYASIQRAAEVLDGDQQVGFVGFTTEKGDLEHLAVSNGCELVADDGTVTLDSPACVQAFDFYDRLITDHSVAGEQDWNAVRASYLAGRSAMAMYSSFILDELAGLRQDLLPSCPECAADRAFLARNTGVIAEIGGADGQQRGQLRAQTDWAVTAGASPHSGAFVEYMMSDGYEGWLGMAPEGKIPDRLGTREEPTRFVDAWRAMPSGAEPRAPLSDFYTPDVVDLVARPADNILWWGVKHGQAPLVGAMLGSQPIEQAMNDMLTDQATPETAVRGAADEVREIQATLQ